MALWFQPVLARPPTSCSCTASQPMAMSSMRLERSFLVLLLLFAAAADGATPVCVARDRDALLAFKAGLVDNGGQLASWTSNGNCCVFKGVTCDTTGQVVNVTFQATVDDECDEDPCNSIQARAGNPNKENLIGATFSKLLALQVLNLTNFLLHDVTPTGLSALKGLKVLALLNTDLRGPVSPDIGRIASLQYLSFDGSIYISLPLPQSLCKLGNLQNLILPHVGFDTDGAGKVSAIPSCFSQLRQLQVLDLHGSAIAGRFPAGLKQLKNLKQLLLSGNPVPVTGAGLTGALPLINPGELPALELLYLDGNFFVGSIPPSFANLVSLKEFKIGGLAGQRSKLSGTIPASLGGLKHLQVLSIQHTSISGPIPSSLALSPSLTDLLLSDNKLTGPIPSNLGASGVLVNLAIDGNSITGSIPASLGGANKKLLTLSAARNLLTGVIPESLSLLHLALLDLSFNQLTGTIPKNLGFALTEGDSTLDLSHNQFTGALNPPSLWDVNFIVLNNNKLTSLGTGSIPDDGKTGYAVFSFDAHSNQLAGTVPDWVFQISFTSTIDISDNKLTKLPAIDGARLFAALDINISVNAFTGTIPAALAQARNSLDAHRNSFTGSIPSFAGSLARIVDLGENQLTGSIPSDIFGQVTRILILSNNKLTGSIPDLPANIQAPSFVDFSYNSLTGAIPASLVSGGFGLERLKLGNNSLSGTIPDFSSGCSGYEVIILENNKLTGPILPPGVDFSACTGLAVYDVSGNVLSGEIPSAIAAFTGLEVLDVSHNALTGSIGAFLSNLHAIKVLDLSFNRLTGGLPLKQLVPGFTALAVAGNSSGYTPGAPLYVDDYFFPHPIDVINAITYTFTTTTALVVSGNALTGPIDPSVGQLKGLHILDLSHNRFTGQVPSSIAGITQLQDLDLSNNLLSGPIPSQLKAFPAADFAGNPGLCGPPTSQACP